MQPWEVVGGHCHPPGPGLLPLHRAKLREQTPNPLVNPPPVGTRFGAEAGPVGAAVQPAVGQHPNAGIELPGISE
jgi:hypothetical protein